MDEHTNLSGLDAASAREYVLHYIVSLKSLQKQRAQLRDDLKLWSDRASLAAEKGRDDLKEQALLRCQDISAKDDQLAAEERTLTLDIEDMKRQLDVIRRQPTPSVNADLLLAQLEQVVGETDMTKNQFREVEAEQALEELKKKLDGQENS